MEGFTVISGNAKQMLGNECTRVTQIASERYKTIKIAHHEWIDTLDDPAYKSSIDTIRTSPSIYSKIQAQFPNSKIQNVTEADEIYWAVSPKDALGSDRSLVDCHYDAPFAWFPTGGVIYYRVIIAMNENNDVSTYFPGEDKRVKMSTGDFHGLDYNKDLHCVEGKIPEGKVRILLKLHYLITPPNQERWEGFVRWLNVTWTVLSRNIMRMSANPQNGFEWIVGLSVNLCRILFNYIYVFLVILICILLIIVYRKTLFKGILRKRSGR